MFFLLRSGGLKLRQHVASTLELESGSNDPAAVFLTVAMISHITEEDTNLLAIAGSFVLQMALGVAFGYLLALYRVPELLASALIFISDNPIIILLMLNLMLLALGMIMDMAALILICTPIFLPVAVSIGVDPIQFGIIMMMNLGLGLCTPPVGACLFVGCIIGGVKIQDAVRTIWPFYAAILVALMLTTYVPAISMTLPNLFE